MKKETLEQVILNNWGISKESERTVEIDGKDGRIIKEKISIKDLFEGRNKTLLNAKVNEVIKLDDESILFVLNIK